MTLVNFNFDANQLKALQETAKLNYLTDEDSPIKKGAIVICSGDYGQQFLQKYANMIKAGYTIPEGKLAELFTVSHGYSYCYLIKPQKLQSADLKVIYAAVEEAYRAELVQKKAEHVEQVARASVAMKLRQREEEKARQEAEELAAARAEVEALYAEELEAAKAAIESEAA
ncbi:hypothetical protein [Pseudomonas sp. BN515]|uniref:hypothetical protein n=1 Tax=Pseudomonas sp. BN515 TaxID=2567892 RepID=UPI002454FE71|nr:hypothetical protein [Pseudomonas sp. BN515]MDH4872903.1 hypothetical protein [Pseudomonas sp. BN515]